jgi:hypothetical protein
MRNPFLFVLASLSLSLAHGADSTWRPLPLVSGGKVDPSWVHIGYGKFIVDDGALRTDPAPQGLGLLVFKKEKFGNCQLRVVFKPKEARSNSGFYVRLDDGILDQVTNPGAAFARDDQGKPSAESSAKMEQSADREEGIWYGVHHGYEVQIWGGGDPSHGTGSLYSLANSSAKVTDWTSGWHTMIVTLDGERVSVELDGQRASEFDASNTNLPPRKIWYEPKREHKRPQAGYIGLQTHDPADIVWFKEISVRPLPKK